MPLKVELSENYIQYLNEPAKCELSNSLMAYAKQLLREANRLEGDIRTTKGDPEITSSMIKDATILINRGYKNSRKSVCLIILKISAVLVSAITGFFIESLNEPWGPYVFAASFSLASILTTISIIKE